MRWTLDTLGGLLALARLAGRSGFRMRGRYWRWRMLTAFGSDRGQMPPAAARRHATLEYGRWVHRMRRYR